MLEPRRDGRLHSRTGGGPRRLACSRSAAAAIPSTRGCTTWAACSRAASCAAISTISASGIRSKYGRSTKRSTSYRRAEPESCAYMHGYDEFRRHLTSLFPREAAGIARYCDKIREIGDSIGVEVHRSGRLSAGGVKYLGASAAEFIGECVADPLLRSVLAGTNPLYGGVRERSPLYHHAMINHSNIEGACRFAGGTQHIADALAARIREHGGHDPRPDAGQARSTPKAGASRAWNSPTAGYCGRRASFRPSIPRRRSA